MKINFSQEEFYNMGFTDDMLDEYDEWPPRDSTQVKISKEKKKKCEVVKLPITSSENNMKNKKCDYKTLAIMTLYSNFNQDEDHRYIYKNDIILNKDEIETLSKNKIDTIMRNVKKLCKLESKVVEAKNTDNGIVYLINYGEENNDEYGYKTYRKYVTIEEEILRYLTDTGSSNLIKTYILLKYRCLDENLKPKETKLTRMDIADNIGLSIKSDNNLKTIGNILTSLAASNLITVHKEYVTEIDESGKERVKCLNYYKVVSYEEWIKWKNKKI